jgi:hypothetical protein
MSVTSAHTIHPDIDRHALRDFAASHGLSVPAAVQQFLQ